MGNKALEAGRDGEPQGGYTVVAYPAASLPVRYRGFVLAKWKRSLRQGNEYFKLVDSRCFFDAYGRYCDLLLGRPGAVVRVAALSEDPDVALGWSLIEGATLHYVYVQPDQRRQGIAKALVPVEIEWITHLTNIGARIWSKHKTVKLDPFR